MCGVGYGSECIWKNIISQQNLNGKNCVPSQTLSTSLTTMQWHAQMKSVGCNYSTSPGHTVATNVNILSKQHPTTSRQFGLEIGVRSVTSKPWWIPHIWLFDDSLWHDSRYLHNGVSERSLILLRSMTGQIYNTLTYLNQVTSYAVSDLNLSPQPRNTMG